MPVGRSPVGRKYGIGFLRFYSTLQPEIKLRIVQDIFQNILALVLAKFRDKNRKKTKNTIFRPDFEVQVGDIVVVRNFIRNLNFRFEFAIKVETLRLLKEILFT